MEQKQKPTSKELIAVLDRLGYPGIRAEQISPFLCEEDGAEYAVWLVDTGTQKCVLKRAKGNELAIYRTFFSERKPYVPAFLGACESGGDAYFLTEYCPGTDLRRCDREKLIKALDALILMQDEFWERTDLYGAANAYDMAQKSIEHRGKFLGSALLDAAFAKFREQYAETPCTLCHDDLLPINLLIGERAVLIDWEYGGMLPYPTSLARLIAHGRERDDAYFYLSRADRDFAIEYYYENLVKKHGIAYDVYRRTLTCFLFFEYCEWVMLGNEYDSRDDERYGESMLLAEEAAKAILGSDK
ncbi:MAG: phosphotransferase [Clostridia bacterium]|nr:phosphotransferase [Clostridia bacterium]